MSKLTSTGEARSLSPILRGPLLLFDQREGPSYAASAGLRLLIIVLVLELVIGPRAHILEFFGLPQPPAWLRTATLLFEALAATRIWAGVRLTDVGFIAPSKWTSTETFYFVEIALGATAAFVVLRGAALHLFDGQPAAVTAAAFLIGPQLLWGFYQEVVYRGLLQTELTRRLGAIAGVLLANLAFTLGPLHFYHLANMRPETTNATFAVIGATFLIGLLFGFIFHRTRNIWIVGLMHGVGNAFINTSGAAAS